MHVDAGEAWQVEPKPVPPELDADYPHAYFTVANRMPETVLARLEAYIRDNPTEYGKQVI